MPCLALVWSDFQEHQNYLKEFDKEFDLSRKELNFEGYEKISTTRMEFTTQTGDVYITDVENTKECLEQAKHASKDSHLSNGVSGVGRCFNDSVEVLSFNIFFKTLRSSDEALPDINIAEIDKTSVDGIHALPLIKREPVKRQVKVVKF